MGVADTLRRVVGILALLLLALWITAVVLRSWEAFLHTHNTTFKKQGEASWFRSTICNNDEFRSQGGILLEEFCLLAWDRLDVTPFLSAAIAAIETALSQLALLGNLTILQWGLLALAAGLFILGVLERRQVPLLWFPPLKFLEKQYGSSAA